MAEAKVKVKAKAKVKAKGKARTIVIRQVRGTVGVPRSQRRILRALGLRRQGKVTEKPDNPAVRGMIGKVIHLVQVEEK